MLSNFPSTCWTCTFLLWKIVYSDLLHILKFVFILIHLFKLEDNYFKILWWVLPYISMNQPCVYLCPHTWSPSHFPPYTIPHSGKSPALLNACFLESFDHKWVLSFVKGFLCICWDNHMIFIFQLVNMVYHIDCFVNCEESLHPWDKANLVIIYDPFNMLLDSVC